MALQGHHHEAESTEEGGEEAVQLLQHGRAARPFLCLLAEEPRRGFVGGRSGRHAAAISTCGLPFDRCFKAELCPSNASVSTYELMHTPANQEGADFAFLCLFVSCFLAFFLLSFFLSFFWSFCLSVVLLSVGVLCLCNYLLPRTGWLQSPRRALPTWLSPLVLQLVPVDSDLVTVCLVTPWSWLISHLSHVFPCFLLAAADLVPACLSCLPWVAPYFFAPHSYRAMPCP